jgi:hypothetical protein
VIVELFQVVASLVVSVALSGFLFGTPGYFYYPAEVAASAASCSSSGTNETCSVELTNVGSGNTSVSAVCTMGGASGQVTSAGVISAGGSREVGYKVIGVATSGGAMISGAYHSSTGRAVYFASRA